MCIEYKIVCQRLRDKMEAENQRDSFDDICRPHNWIQYLMIDFCVTGALNLIVQPIRLPRFFHTLYAIYGML